MKKSKLFIVAIMLVTIMASCHRSSPTTTIAMRTDNVSMKVEYSGWITFSADKTSIQSMSPGSYLKYKRNGDQLIAECDSKGNIIYRFYGNKTAQLTDEGKQILIQAIKVISDQQAKQRSAHHS